MAPVEPPPYTSEQVAAMKSPEERARAAAELTSYIQRLKTKMPKRQEAQHPPGPQRTTATRGGFGNVAYSNGAYHPYRRPEPPLQAQKFRNDSTVVNGAASIKTEPSDTKDQATTSTLGINKPDAKQGFPNTLEDLCPTFTSTGIRYKINVFTDGICERPRCRHRHDPTKLALCKPWLYKDHCRFGDFCNLSHTASPHNAPTCLHFSGGLCTNDECRFAHIRINPSAPNCEAFGILGYCEKGDKCAELHAHKCPTFANTGACRFGDMCRLGHGFNALRMRNASRPSSGPPSPTDSHEQLVKAEPTQELVSSLMPAPSDETRQFTQQVDFVPLDQDHD
ncbi:hypothetical protein IQ07DRAFT_639617 [Pyrenochaeta sp. DS3sAY3a]|nr:hypothetical protein IQ07DRAFT_639617 [Pyrenochaeta sp. DS3sAY3a]